MARDFTTNVALLTQILHVRPHLSLDGETGAKEVE